MPPVWREALAQRGLLVPEWDRDARAWWWPDEGAQSVRFLHEAYGVELDDAAAERAPPPSRSERLKEAESRLRPYQREGVRFMVDRRRAMLADGMGLGKTAQALLALENLDAYPAIVLAPASVKIGWASEVVQWVPWRSVQILWSGRDRIQDCDILVLNPELLPRRIEELILQAPRAVVLDEAHQYKNPRAQRSNLAEDLMDHVDVRFALTGTPIPNRRPDILQQLHLLGTLEDVLGIYRGVLPHYWQPGEPLRHEWALKALERLPRKEVNERLRSTCFLRRTKNQVQGELPDFHRTRRELALPDASPYLAREQSFIDWVRAQRRGEEGEWKPETRFAGRQHLSVLRREAALAKIPAVVEWAEGLDKERVVYFSHHKQVARELAAALPGEVPLITGDVAPKERARIIRDMASYPAVVATMDASGQGVDGMQAHARHVVFIELDWTPTKHEQCEGRLHRIGQHDPVEAWYFTARQTIDDAMMRRLDQKWKDLQGIVEGEDEATLDAFVGTVLERASRGVRGEGLWHS